MGLNVFQETKGSLNLQILEECKKSPPAVMVGLQVVLI